MPSGYNYNGAHLVRARSIYDVQHQDNGILELNINRFVPDGKQILMESLQSFQVPGRNMGDAVIPYIHGNQRYLTRPDTLENVTAVFRDLPQQGSRFVLHELFRTSVYDEETGFQVPDSIGKFDGFVVLFGSDGQNERRALLEGLRLKKVPPIAVDYTQGEHMTLEVEFTVDRVLWTDSLAAPVSN